MLLEVAFAVLSPWVFWAGVGLMVLGFALGEASWLALVLLYPWWRLWRGWRLRLFPDHLSLHPPLGLIPFPLVSFSKPQCDDVYRRSLPGPPPWRKPGWGGISRRIPWEGVREVEVAYWPAGPLSQGRRALVLHLENGEEIPLPVPDLETLAARIRELLRGRTSGSGFRDG